MKRLLLQLFIIILITACSIVWKEFKTDNFKIFFPDKPESKNIELYVKDKKHTFQSHYYEGSGRYFSIAYGNIQENILKELDHKRKINAFLSQFVEKNILSKGFQIMYQKEYKFNKKYNGLEVQVKNRKYKSLTRIIIVNNTLYFLEARFLKNYYKKEIALKFLDSFTLI